MDFSFLAKKFTDFFITAIVTIYALILGGFIYLKGNIEYDKLLHYIFSSMEINTIGMIIVFLLGLTLIYSASSGIYGVILLIKSFFKSLIKEKSKGSFKEKLKKIGKNFFTSNIDNPITFPNGRIKTRSDVREIANAHISQFWTIDFLETTYKLHFSLAIISVLFAVIGIFYLRSMPFSLFLFIVSFFQYIAACDYKESFDKSFDSVWNAICFDVENKLTRDDR